MSIPMGWNAILQGMFEQGTLAEGEGQFFQGILTISTLNLSDFYRIKREIMRYYEILQKFMVFHKTNTILLV